MATLQVGKGNIVRFRADFSGRTRIARAQVTELSFSHAAWRSFESAHRILGLASCLERFESTMQAPVELPG
jgi:hypothetical protein